MRARPRYSQRVAYPVVTATTMNPFCGGHISQASHPAGGVATGVQGEVQECSKGALSVEQVQELSAGAVLARYPVAAGLADAVRLTGVGPWVRRHAAMGWWGMGRFAWLSWRVVAHGGAPVVHQCTPDGGGAGAGSQCLVLE